MSAKYGLGEVLFRERNTKNNNSNDSFYIRVPKDWPTENVFEIWDCVLEESHAFLEENNLEYEMGICGISVSQRY